VLHTGPRGSFTSWRDRWGWCEIPPHFSEWQAMLSSETFYGTLESKTSDKGDNYMCGMDEGKACTGHHRSERGPPRNSRSHWACATRHRFKSCSCQFLASSTSQSSRSCLLRARPPSRRELAWFWLPLNNRCCLGLQFCQPQTGFMFYVLPTSQN
jgi:hypothetical protein